MIPLAQQQAGAFIAVALVIAVLLIFASALEVRK